MMLLLAILQCKNSVNWEMKALEGGSEFVKPPTTIKQLMDAIMQL